MFVDNISVQTPAIARQKEEEKNFIKRALFCIYIMGWMWSDSIIMDPARLSRGTDAANTQTALQR